MGEAIGTKVLNKALEGAFKTLKAEQAGLGSLKKVPAGSFRRALKLLKNREGKIIIVGVGKSGFVGMKTAATFTSLGHQAVFLHPVEALHGDLGVVTKGDVVIAVSFSGTSQEVVRIVTYLRKAFGASILALTGSKHSALAKLSDVVIPITLKDEGSPHDLAPMASTTATLVVGDMLASGLTVLGEFEKHHFAKFHPGGTLGLSLTKVEDTMEEVDVPLASIDQSLTEVLSLMTKGGLGVVGVVDDKKALSGIITDGDVRRFFQTHTSSHGKIARDVMTKSPKTITPNKTLKDALVVMEKHKIITLFVINRVKRPVGILHMHAIVEGHML